MSWLEHKIRRYEHRRWTTDDNRRVLPFEWGLEHIGGRADEPDPRGFLNHWVEHTLAHSGAWFATTPADNYRLADGVLTFTSQVRSPWAQNNLVHARFFPAKHSGPAVVLLPNWNAKWDGQVQLCRWLNTLGITVLRLSLPYHDRRNVPGHERADHLVGPNIGLTLQANRQAVIDTRRCLYWLEQNGYTKLGLVGTTAVLVLFGLFLTCGFRMAMATQDLFSKYLICGLVGMLGLEAMINIAVVTGLLPTKGLPLPLISYGGTSMVMNIIACALIFQAHRHGEPRLENSLSC